MVLYLCAAEPGSLLGVDQADAGQRAFVPQVFLPSRVAAIDLLHRLEPPFVMEHAGKFGEPGAQSIGHSVRYPEPNLCLALHAVFPPVWFLNADTKDADDGFATHGGAELLSVLSVRPWHSKATARLPVGDQGWRKLANSLHVQGTGGSSAGIGNDARIRVELARGRGHRHSRHRRLDERHRRRRSRSAQRWDIRRRHPTRVRRYGLHGGATDRQCRHGCAR